MYRAKINVTDLKPGDKVMLQLPDVKGLTDTERENRVLVEATVIAIYPHCIQFETIFDYMITPCFHKAEEMITGVEHHGKCPGNERAIDRRAGGKTRKGWKVYE